MSLSYRINETNPPSITCLVCGLTSWNANDVENRYCGFCHRFHEDSLNVDELRARAQEIVCEVLRAHHLTCAICEDSLVVDELRADAGQRGSERRHDPVL
jgi:hypothetical protein